MRSNNRRRSRTQQRGGSPGSSRVMNNVASCNYSDKTFEQFFPEGDANPSQGVYYKTSGGGKHHEHRLGQHGGYMPSNRIFSQLSSCLDNNANSSYDQAPADLSGDMGTNYFSVSNGGQSGGRRRRTRRTRRTQKRRNNKSISKSRSKSLRNKRSRRTQKRGGSCGATALKKQNGGGYGGKSGNYYKL